jgi:diguanylate cyclase (GGDEF)-like protein
MSVLQRIQNQIHRGGPALIWGATAAGLTVMFLFFAAIALDYYRSAVEINEQAAQNIAALIEQSVARDIELYDLSLQSVIDGLSNSEVMKQSAEVRQIALFDRSATAQGLGALVLLNEKGDILLDSVAVNPRRGNFEDREYFSIHRDAAKDVGLYISRPFHARLQGNIWSISLSRRVTNPDGSFGGIVSGTVKLDYFRQRFDQIAVGSGGSITLLRDDGVVLAHNLSDESVFGADWRADPALKHARTAESGTFYSAEAADRVPRFYAFERIGNLPLVVSVGLSEKDVLASWWSKVWILTAVFLFMAASVLALVFLFVSELKLRVAAEAAEAQRARQDNLTKLANRLGFDEALAREWKRGARDGKSLTLLMIDIDYFKLFNDCLGHPEGDRVLAAVGKAVADSIQRPGDMAARYGGEEIAVLLPNIDRSGGLKVAETIHANIGKLEIIHPRSPHSMLTVSIGIATAVPGPSTSPEALLMNADRALYEAKSAGRNTIRQSNVSAPQFGLNMRRAAG